MRPFILLMIQVLAWCGVEYYVNRHHISSALKKKLINFCFLSLAMAFAIFVPFSVAMVIMLVLQCILDHYVYKNTWTFSILLTSLFFVIVTCVVLCCIVISEVAIVRWFALPAQTYTWASYTLGFLASLILSIFFGHSISEFRDALHASKKVTLVLALVNGILPLFVYMSFVLLNDAMNAIEALDPYVGQLWMLLKVLFLTITVLYFVASFSMTFFFIKYKRRADYDGMTQTLNKTAGICTLKGMIQKASIEQKPISIAFVDIDALKRINDEHGHDEGDRAIMKTVSALKKNVRATDHIIRYGGDEFILVMYNCDKEQVEAVLRRVNDDLDSDQIGEQAYELGFSYGIKTTIPEMCLDPEFFIIQADQEMYKRKFLNKVMTYNV